MDTAKATSEICVPPFDVLLLTANFNQLSVGVKILEKNDTANNPMSNIEMKFHPIFDVTKDHNVCFKLKLNTAYANILGEPVRKFLKDLLDGINNDLLHCDENNVPDKNDAIMVSFIRKSLFITSILVNGHQFLCGRKVIFGSA